MLVHEGTIPAVVALGMLLVIISGGIDLSVGSVVALVTVVTMQVYRHLGAARPAPWLSPSLAAVAAGIAAADCAGWPTAGNSPGCACAPFVATLGMLGVARGLAVWLAGRAISWPSRGEPARAGSMSSPASTLG